MFVSVLFVISTLFKGCNTVIICSLWLSFNEFLNHKLRVFCRYKLIRYDTRTHWGKSIQFPYEDMLSSFSGLLPSTGNISCTIFSLLHPPSRVHKLWDFYYFFMFVFTAKLRVMIHTISWILLKRLMLMTQKSSQFVHLSCLFYHFFFFFVLFYFFPIFHNPWVSTLIKHGLNTFRNVQKIHFAAPKLGVIYRVQSIWSSLVHCHRAN